MPAHLIAEEGPHRGRLLNLEEGDEWTLGRDPKAAFVIEDETVSRRAARLTRSPEGIHLENLSRVNPTLVNDEPVEGARLLNEGDRIQIGHTVFLFSEAALPETGAETPKSGYDDIFGSLDDEAPPVETTPPKRKEKKKKSETGSAYDTIFEDTSEGAEPLPFNLLKETPFLLKVISGPNAGAEIGMEKGRSYTLGKDPETCDIVFQDLSVSRNHARFTISEEGAMEIEDLGSKNGTVVNGVPVTVKQPVTTQDMVALGTTIFLIIDREAPQETIYSPMVPTYEAPKPEAAAPLAEAPAEIAAEVKKDWKKEPIPTKYLVGAAAFAAIFLIVFLSFFSLFKSNQVEVAHKEPVSRIQKALAKFEGVQFSFNPASGKLFLVGHVLTAVEAQEMRFRISEIDFITATEDSVVIDEVVDKMMNDVLNGNPEFRGVAIQSPKPGKFIATGYIDTNNTAMLLAEYLTVNFPYLDRLENEVVVGENLNTQIQGLLLSKGFGALSFQYANGEVVLAGNYSEKMGSQFQDLLKEIDKVKGVSGVKNFAVATTPNQAAIDVSGQFQVTGISQHEGKGFSAILNGKIYTIGNQVSGMEITEIDPTTILLEKEGIKYKINYTR
jgi:type III secretion system YscD/HrpQ family protein